MFCMSMTGTTNSASKYQPLAGKVANMGDSLHPADRIHPAYHQGPDAIADAAHVPSWRANIMADKERMACRADRRRG